MANNGLFWVAGGVALLLLLSGSAFGSPVFSTGATLDVSSLSTQYGADSANAIYNLYHALSLAKDPNTGNKLTDFQIRALLCQALVETGLFTDSPNWRNVNANNFAGINAHNGFSKIPGTTANYAAYPSINSFVNDWLNVLNYNNQPIEATDLNDFNQRLVENGYYSANSAVYGQNLQAYWNILDNNIA